MKIAYLSTFYPFRGGIAQFNAALYREFEKNHQIKAFTFTRQYPDLLFPGKSQYVGPEDNADKIESDAVLDTVNPISYFKAARKLKEYSPGLTITKFWMPFFAPSLGRVKKSLKNSSVNISILDNVIPHERRPMDIRLTKYFLKQNHGFIVMSETVKNDLLSLKPDARFKFCPHPLYNHFGSKVDKIAAREKLGISPGKKVLLFFGFIRQYKGLDVLLEALNMLPDEYHLVVAGEVYGKFDNYREIIEKHNLQHKLTINNNYISDDETPLYFSAADVCMLPYKSATQSGIVGISYNFGLPVIATDVGSLGEMIRPYETGMMVDKASPELIKNAVIDYFRNGKAQTYSENIEKYKKIASWESLANNILELYGEIRG
jgi:glycosyltransferase involved in cell wall biosynthesis